MRRENVVSVARYRTLLRSRLQAMAQHGERMTLMPREPERTISARTWVVALVTVLVLLGIAALATLRHVPPNAGTMRAPDAYANSLPLSSITMTEATNGAGGKLTYVDGIVGNTGSRILTGAQVQVIFTMVDGSPPYRETVPLELIRTREPYVDLQPVSSAPLTPGTQREFRLIFETIPATWNVKPPQMQIVHAELK